MIKRYSENFKRHVVKELECGQLVSQTEARRRYGIAGKSTIRGWLDKYGQNESQKKVVRIEMPSERKEIEILKEKIGELESALATTRMRELVNEVYLEIACEETGLDLEEFKKKQKLKRSRESRSNRKKRS